MTSTRAKLSASAYANAALDQASVSAFKSTNVLWQHDPSGLQHDPLGLQHDPFFSLSYKKGLQSNQLTAA